MVFACEKTAKRGFPPRRVPNSRVRALKSAQGAQDSHLPTASRARARHPLPEDSTRADGRKGPGLRARGLGLRTWALGLRA